MTKLLGYALLAFVFLTVGTVCVIVMGKAVTGG